MTLNEKNVLRTNLQSDHCYVLDRWFAQFKLFNDCYEMPEEKPLSDEAQAAARHCSR